MTEKPMPLTDAVTYICDEGSVLRVCEGLTEVAPADFARRLELALAGAEEALQQIDSTAKSHPYAGNTCGELARAALAQIEELRK